MELKDENLWRIAKKRADFKKHLYTYIIINGFLWAIWYVTRGSQQEELSLVTAWPIWPTLGWGIGVAFNYVDAYHSSKEDSVEREYEKLKREQQNKTS
jgi:hypothetical protein